MTHKIIYAGAIEYCATWEEWPRCTWAEAIRKAYAAAMKDAATYGDKMHGIVSIDGRHVTTRENIEARKL